MTGVLGLVLLLGVIYAGYSQASPFILIPFIAATTALYLWMRRHAIFSISNHPNFSPFSFYGMILATQSLTVAVPFALAYGIRALVDNF